MTPLSSHRLGVFASACLGILLLMPTAMWSQVDTNAAEVDTSPGDEVAMQAPPPVSGIAYATAFTSETDKMESNYLRGGLTITGAYSSNVSGSTTPVGGASYSLWPTLALDKNTSRAHYLFSCSPGFTFYPHTSSLNQANLNAAFAWQYRLSPNMTVSLNEAFQKTSNIFNQPDPLSGTVVSGSAPAPGQAIVPPAADQVTNSATAQITYQLDANSMIGAGGTFASLRFPNPVEVPGLFSSNSAAGSAFYSHRLLDKYYIGATYQYQNIDSYQAGTQNIANTHIQTQTIFFFLSIYLKPALSLSVSAGPQRFTATQWPLPGTQSWSPLMMASIGWRGGRTSLSASYARIVTAAGGLNGAYQSNTASASARWQMTRTWSAGISASYALYNTLTPSFSQTTPGGHTLSGTASVGHPLGEHIRAQAGYSWVQQNYGGPAAISNLPNTNFTFVSISYQFARPLQ